MNRVHLALGRHHRSFLRKQKVLQPFWRGKEATFTRFAEETRSVLQIGCSGTWCSRAVRAWLLQVAPRLVGTNLITRLAPP